VVPPLAVTVDAQDSPTAAAGSEVVEMVTWLSTSSVYVGEI
jgi:hypothetical protein